MIRHPLVLSLMILLMIGCGNKLTRSKAAELINNSEKFKSVAGGSYLVCIDLCLEVWFQSIGTPYTAEFQYGLVSLGYLNVSRVSLRSWPIPAYRFSFTEKGKTLAKNWKLLERGNKLGDGSTEVYEVLFLHADVLEIRGITTAEDDRTAVVEYTWRQVPTALGEEFLKAGLIKPGMRNQFGGYILRDDIAQIQKGRSAFQLYDDGWRMQ